MLSIQILVLVLSFFVISWAGAILVRSLTMLSKLLGISEYMIAFILMSFATSIPDFSIGISSALQHAPSISFGDVLGENLMNVTLIIGLIAVLAKGLSTESKISKTNFWLVFLLAFTPIILALDGLISRGDGTLLLAIFVFYILRLVKDKKYFKNQHIENGIDPKHKFASTMKGLKNFSLGVLLLIASSFSLIWAAKGITDYLEISTIFFGIVFVAIGTTLPELVFGIKAYRMRHPSMILGNALGSIAFNSTAVTGIVALINPINIQFNGHILVVTIFLGTSFILFNIFAYSKTRISSLEGVMLILLYILFIFAQTSL